MEAIAKGEELRGIAIISMAGRFPGAGDLEQFWANLRDGRESITSFKEPEKNRVHAAGILEEAADFDAVFFGMTPREAEMTDPQHRLFLECAYEALESAGYPPTRCPERVGVYAGSGQSDYLQHVLSHDELVESFGPFQIGIGNHPDFLATRVSYKLNLNGPSVAVQTACSSSLVAVHMACQALLTYECDMAIAGGVSVKADQTAGFDYQEGGILSPDGHCRAFDAKSQGTAVGNGAGAVLLKRLDEAVSDGDVILAVIRGSAVNNDGAQKVGYTAPSVTRQAEVVREALAVSEIDPATMTYIEAHGTGTALGDPVEVAALTEAYREATNEKQYCAIGSVKTNIGHLDSAAGIAGLIKTVLCLQNKMLPPSLHYTEPNPKIDFANSPFYVNDRLREWKTDGHPRRAGISSFGMGGTNAHVVLEEAPLVKAARHPEAGAGAAKTESEIGAGTGIDWNVIVLSAKTTAALRRKTERLIGYLQTNRDVPLSDVAYTLAAGRETFARRLAVVGRDRGTVADELKAKLADLSPSGRDAQESAGGGEMPLSVTFMFTGQGAQHIYMGAELYESAPVYREQVDRCAERLQPLLGLDLRNVLYPPPSQAEEAASRLRQTALTQPALFVLEYALAKQLEAWGVRPQAMIGHSIGEYVAACLAGVMTVDDALTAVAVRGSLMQEMDRGAMLAIALSEAEVRELLATASPELSVAAVNGPMSCVVSGPFEAIERLEQALGRRNAVSKRLVTSHAYHSAMMEPMLERFAGVMRGIALHAPQLPYVSNVTGTWITAGQATDPMYWVRHLRDTVRFADGIRLLSESGRTAFLEIGPGQSLTSLVRQQTARNATLGVPVVNTLPPAAAGKSAYASVLQALGELWSAGADIDCAAWHEGKMHRRAPLPTYPFERYRYYLEKKVRVGPAASADAALAAGQERRADMADWFYAPVWKQTFLPPQPSAYGDAAPHKRTYLLFHDRYGLAEALSEGLKSEGHDVVAVLEGGGFRQVEEDVFTIHPAQGRSYEELLHALAAQQRFPDAVVHLWNVIEPESEGEDVPVPIAQRYARSQQLGLYSLMHLAQAIGMQAAKRTDLIVLTGCLQWVAHEQVRSPERATLFGALRVIPQEYAQIRARTVDVSLADLASASSGRLIRQLLQEIEHGGGDFVVAYRGMQRFTQIYEPVKLPEADPADAAFRDGGVYLVTGATSEIGLRLCEEIARTAKVSFVLIGDASFPAAREWEHYLLHIEESDDTAGIIKRIRALEQNGTPLLYASADLTDESGLRDIVRQAERQFGAIHGVLFAQEPYGSGLIQLGDRERSERVIAPQALGLLALESLLRSHPLELMVVFSRTISFTGGVGLMDQCASHHFVDAFAKWHAAAGGRTVAVNWGMWQDDVWVRKQTELPADIKEHMLQMQATFGITGAEGLEAIRRIAASGLSQAVVSTQSIQDAAGNGWLHAAGQGAASDSRQGRADAGYQAGDLVQEPPQTEEEHKIAAIWEMLFGIPDIGRRQSFFDLGGNSLLSIQLVARLRQAFHGDIPMDVIFQSPTIADLAESIAQTQVKPEELDEIERLLSEIENMPQDELMQLLSREG